jgi:hypothetical protein
MENVKSSISRHNKRVLAKAEPMESPIPSECPLQKKCLTKGIVYKAVIKTKEDCETKEYIRMSTANDFKVRYRNHMKSFKHIIYEYDTKLSKYVWKLKNAGKDYGIKWSILKRAPSYLAGGKYCSLCTEENLCLLKANKTLIEDRKYSRNAATHRNSTRENLRACATNERTRQQTVSE